MNKKLISNWENWKLLIIKKDEEFVIKNKDKKLKIKNNAPNCVQKNIKYAASMQRLVFANLYRIKNDGIKSISYAKKNKIMESVKNKTEPAIKIKMQYSVKSIISFTL
jgi:hypothetical protein